MKLAREVKIGITVLVAFVVLIWGFNFLKGRDIFFTGDIYYGVYNRVDGLTDASPVYYKGFKVGTVRTIDIHPDDQQRFLVTFAIFKKVRFPKNTVAEIYSLDLMGTKGVQLIPGDTPGYMDPGDTFSSSVMGDLVDQMSIQVLPLKEKTEKLIVKLDSTLTQLSGFLGNENQRQFAASLRELNTTLSNVTIITESLKQQVSAGGNLDNTLKNLDGLSSSVNGQKDKIKLMIDNFSEFSTDLQRVEIDKTVENLKNTLDEAQKVFAAVNSGEGSAGMLMKDKQLYYRLTDASSNLDRLLMDVRHNPKRYLHFSAIDFGKSDYVANSSVNAEGIVFEVLIKESKTPLDWGGKEIEPGLRIFEDFSGNSYIYVVGQFRNYEEAQALQEKLKPTYSDATVIALKSGKPIKLSKAIKQSSQK
jgi:phospholipid/cholesterol/gamma-HCH transport system substrate-binding protein